MQSSRGRRFVFSQSNISRLIAICCFARCGLTRSCIFLSVPTLAVSEYVSSPRIALAFISRSRISKTSSSYHSTLGIASYRRPDLNFTLYRYTSTETYEHQRREQCIRVDPISLPFLKSKIWSIEKKLEMTSLSEDIHLLICRLIPRKHAGNFLNRWDWVKPFSVVQSYSIYTNSKTRTCWCCLSYIHVVAKDRDWLYLPPNSAKNTLN